LCQIIAEKIVPNKENKPDKQPTWDLEDVKKAVDSIENEVNTNFESLIKNLENHKDLYDLVYKILIDGAEIPFNSDNATIHKGIVYGIFKRNGRIKIHNQIYQQRIYNYMISNEITKHDNLFNESQFILPNDVLNFERILQRFQAYMKEYYSSKRAKYVEKEWRLIFLAFLKPIINGKGHTFIEPEISEERRLDIAVTYGKNKYIVELKLWHGAEYHERGIVQLADYLEKQDLDTGYLVIFDYRRKHEWTSEWIALQGKRIFAIWM
jgi:hypothetical protein